MNAPIWADFRSDACTIPSAPMRSAMAEAHVGNDTDEHQNPNGKQRSGHEARNLAAMVTHLYLREGLPR